MPISVSAPGREHPVVGTSQRHQYPWDDLHVGDWFFVPHDYESEIISDRDHSMMQGRLAAQMRRRNKFGDKHRYMHFRADQGGVPGIKVMRVK